LAGKNEGHTGALISWGGSEQDNGEIAMVEKKLIVFRNPFLTKFTLGDTEEWSNDCVNRDVSPERERKMSLED